MTRLHVTLLQSLRHEGKFAQALRQTEKLIEENPDGAGAVDGEGTDFGGVG